MPSFTLERIVPAPVERVFALSLDVGVHVESMSAHDERIVGGTGSETGSGRMGEGDTVTWDARHFGIRFRMTSLVCDVDEPHGFSDRQLRGPFAEFRHRHTFEPVAAGTLLRDEIVFRSPFGALSRLVDATIMRRHLIRLIEQRNDTLTALAAGVVG
jgi:ligand-binding SRPBCC domain-containing protein